MAKVQHTCTGCVPIDSSILETYIALQNAIASSQSAASTAADAAAAANGAAASANGAATAANNAALSANAAAAAANAAGITQAEASVDANTGVPSVDVSLVNKKLTLAFHNVKGEKGDKGDRGDGAVPIVNDLTTGGTDAALSAEMGKTLNNTKQANLVSGTNIKTVNGESLLGSGNIIAGDPNAVKYTEQTLTDAQKTQARTNIGAGTGTYTKAAAGIPKTDLESAVQASLDLADTAIQARPSGEVDPTITPAEYATQEELSQLDQKVEDFYLPIITGKTVSLGGTIGATINLTPQDESGWNCVVFPCVRDDAFTINGRGGNSTRLWGFVDAENKLIEVSTAALVGTNLKVIAPANSAYFVSNGNGALSVLCRKADSLIYKLSETEEMVFVADSRTTGGYIDKDSGEFTNTGVSASYVDTFLNITGGASYKICGRVGSNTQTCLGAFYDENGNFISSFSPSGGSTTAIYDYSATAPANASILKVYGNTSDAVQASVTGFVKSTVQSLQKQINQTGLISFVKSSRITGGFIDKDTGDFTFTGVSNSYVDTFTGITPGAMYSVSGRVGSNTQTCLGAFYDASGRFISSFSPSGGITTAIYDYSATAPNGASILKVYGNVTDAVQATVVGTMKTTVSNIVPQIQGLNYKNFGKSIGVFGGSFSVNAESQAAKSIWRNKLGVTITDYGVSGAGFSSLQGTSIQQQVDGAAVKDIYILWASTNDFTNSRDCGTWSDYTALDNYDSSKLTTQCGGINYCIKKLLTINPNAEIYFFTSLRFFTMESGYNPFSTQTNSTGKTFREYVEAQKQCCEYYGIPLLDQYNIQGVNIFNYTNYYKDDNLHMKEDGYRKIGWTQAEFLANGE